MRGEEKSGGEGRIQSTHPKKFSAVMVKLKSFAVNERIVEKPLCQCHCKIGGLGFRQKSWERLGKIECFPHSERLAPLPLH